jgi:hypothetical protein
MALQRIERALEIPDGTELFPIPAHTPELNASERLWSPLREAAANRTLQEIEEMEEILIKTMNDLSKRKEYLSAMTNYHWLPSP